MKTIKTKYITDFENEANNEKTVSIDIPYEHLKQEIHVFINEMYRMFENIEKTKSKSQALVKEYLKRIDSFILTIHNEIKNELEKIKEIFF